LDFFKSFGMPADVQKMSDQATGQISSAMGEYMKLFQGATPGMPPAGTTELTTKAISYATTNVSTTFSYMQSLMAARDVPSLLKLQTEFFQSQMIALNDQIKDLTETAMKSANPSSEVK
jgi:hypothetical protein